MSTAPRQRMFHFPLKSTSVSVMVGIACARYTIGLWSRDATGCAWVAVRSWNPFVRFEWGIRNETLWWGETNYSRVILEADVFVEWDIYPTLPLSALPFGLEMRRMTGGKSFSSGPALCTEMNVRYAWRTQCEGLRRCWAGGVKSTYADDDDETWRGRWRWREQARRAGWCETSVFLLMSFGFT